VLDPSGVPDYNAVVEIIPAQAEAKPGVAMAVVAWD